MSCKCGVFVGRGKQGKTKHRVGKLNTSPCFLPWLPFCVAFVYLNSFLLYCLWLHMYQGKIRKNYHSSNKQRNTRETTIEWTQRDGSPATPCSGGETAVVAESARAADIPTPAPAPSPTPPAAPAGIYTRSSHTTHLRETASRFLLAIPATETPFPKYRRESSHSLPRDHSDVPREIDTP